MKIFEIILLSVIVLSSIRCSSENKKHPYEVKYFGALKNIMHKGDLSAKANLSVLDTISNLYALGAIENLKGEIQIFNSEPYNSYVSDDSMAFDRTLQKSATLLVYSKVREWHSITIPGDIRTKNDFETFIIRACEGKKIDASQAFPFLLDGEFESIDWHVIDWVDGDLDHSHEKHIKSGLYGQLKNTTAQFLGFYSDSHHAIFTHHTTNMHIHMKTHDNKIAGHVDDFRLGQNMILKLPKN